MTDWMTAVGIFATGASAGALLDHVRFSNLARETTAGLTLNHSSPASFSSFQTSVSGRFALKPYLWAMCAVATGLGLVLALPILQTHLFFAVFYVVAALVAFLHGFGPALFAISASTMAIDFFIMPPRFGWTFKVEVISRLMSFVLASVVITGVIRKSQTRHVAAARQLQTLVSSAVEDSREHPRFSFNADLIISLNTGAEVRGTTLDISEAGLSALVLSVLPVGEAVELEFNLPLGPLRVSAVVRQKRAARYGFKFVGAPDGAMLRKIRESCCLLRRIS